MSKELTTTKKGELPEVDIGEKLELSPKEVAESLTRLGGVKLTKRRLDDLNAAGYSMRGVNGYRTLAGELVVSRFMLHETMKKISNKLTESSGMDDLVNGARALSTLQGEITAAVKVSTDILKAQNPGAAPVDPGSLAPTATSFPPPQTTIIGGQHVHTTAPVIPKNEANGQA